MKSFLNKIKIIITIFIFTIINISLIHAATDIASSSTIGKGELHNEVIAEKARITQLKKKLNPSVGIIHSLKKGSSGNEVKILQQFLKVYGTYTASSTDGHFGPKTEQAVRKFQAKESLSPIGVVGSKTREKILTLSSYAFNKLQTQTMSASSTVASSTLSSNDPTIIDAILCTDVGEDGSGISSYTTFASTTNNIYAVLTLSNAKQETEVGFIRYFKNTYIDSGVTHLSRSGLRYAHFQWSLKSWKNRAIGPYTVVFYINNNKSKTLTFNIN